MAYINAQYLRRQMTEDGTIELIFAVKGATSQISVQDLKKDTIYRLQMTEIKSKRTIQQNNALWVLIDEIAQRTGNDSMDVYCKALEEAGAKYQYIACLPDAEQMLRKAFRCIKLVNQFEHKGKTFNQYRCYEGSSKMDTKEMSMLLDTVIKMAAEMGIYLQEIGEEWKI